MQQFYNKAMLFGPVVIITTGSPLPSAEVGFAYSTPLVAQGGVGPYTFALFSGSLPAGLSIVGASIAGTPTTIQVMNPNIRATDSLGHQSAVKAFNITVISGVSITTTSPLPNATQGTAYTDTMAASGGAGGYVWSLVSQTGTNGWVVSSGGVVSGTPAHVETDNLTIKVTDALGYAAQGIFSLLVNSATGALAITTTSPLPNATQSTPYTDTMAATGGVPPYTWSLLGQTGSNGWSVSSAGVVSGTPSVLETDTLTIQVLDSMSTPSSGNFNLTVNTVSASWKTLPVGGGGYVRGLIMAADGTMIGRTDTAGAYLWNAGTSSWNQLFNANSMPASFISANFNAGLGGCYEVAIAPSNTQIFYAAYANLMFRSTNQGSTWTQVTSIGGSNPNDNNAQIGQKMAVDPNNANIVYAGLDGGGLRVTVNGGSTWSTVAGVPAGTTAGVCGIVFGPASNQIAGVTQVIYACRQGTGVYVTTNGGTSWTQTSGGPTTVQNAQLDAAGNYWCSGNGSAVWKYTASGGTWASVAAGGGNGIQAVAINPFNGNQIVGVDQSGHITYSGDAGVTWTGIIQHGALVSTDIPWLGPTSTVGGSGNNFFITSGNAIFSPVTPGLLYISSGVGVWSIAIPGSMTSGTSYTLNDLSIGIENLVSNEIIVPPGQGPVVASWDRAVFYLTTGTYPSYYLPITDGGINAGWSVDYASSDPTFTCASVAFQSQLSGFSHNSGASWTTFPTKPTGIGNGGCIAASTPSNMMFGVSSATAPSYTLDGGTTWTQISIPGISSWSGFLPGNPAGCWRKICADRVNANTFYLYSSGVAAGVGVYITTNGGATWTQQHSGYIETNSSYANVLDPQMKAVPGQAGNLFYCSGANQFNGATITSPLSDAGFFRSINAGVTWTAIPNVLMVSSFGFGAPKPSGGGYPAVYINGFVSGVWGLWRSDDNCATWVNIGTFAGPNGLGSVVTMSGDMSIYGRCYAGIGGFGAGGYGAGASYAYYG